jgi:hypothetical protein
MLLLQRQQQRQQQYLYLIITIYIRPQSHQSRCPANSAKIQQHSKYGDLHVEDEELASFATKKELSLNGKGELVFFQAL